MEIKVKRIGTTRGTVGWLAKGLASEELRLVESTLKESGNHGLWLKGNSVNQFLGAYNQYNCSPSEVRNANRYDTAQPEDNTLGCTDACWISLMAIAAQWCEQCNAAIEAEQAIAPAIIRVLS